MKSALELSSKNGLWGDQGDGTYINPILPGDFSDPDVIRVGSDFYCISSTLHFSPGMVILHSKDLVNWVIIGHVVDDLTQISPELNFDKMNRYGRGVWAGAIRYYKDKFWVYFCTPDEGFFMSSSTRPEGPWEPLQHIWQIEGWDDCCPFWDEDGQGYLAATNFSNEYKMHLFQMNEEGNQIRKDTDFVFHQYKGSEATKIYKIDGLYYFFHSEVRHQAGKDLRVVMMLRSSHIRGPYEEKELIHSHGEALDREPNQGGLLQTEDGTWYFISHQGTGGYYEGRTLHLLPVTWVDGWPIIGEDIDGDGIGEMVWGGKKPIQGYPLITPSTSVNFTNARLEPQWEWNHQPRAGKWSLTERQGYLRLHACVPLEVGNFFTVCNILTQRSLGTVNNVVVTKIDLSGMEDGQEAGLCHFGTRYCTISIKQEGTVRTIQYNDTGIQTIGSRISQCDLWLRSCWGLDGINTFSYSLDGKNFIDFDERYQLNWGHYRGDRIGLFSFNNKAENGYLDIEWFHYRYAMPQGR
ncbi:glycosyl hydrolase 43 family protein [Paenibacillus sp. CGMCC 1.16610]|uniref:glycoside hydrolase family 43 protein n=1 Tax=Paenibacillus TaxID=44249 RepID=UPI0015EF6484|nr:glycoside hydrolase 43 family protein [Paenibacillus sp. CGMCC 1.16610]MBA2939594.1 glycosyl hydrolase 43 family protein [Paenibacillus sp. CGMCC 1.16610]